MRIMRAIAPALCAAMLIAGCGRSEKPKPATGPAKRIVSCSPNMTEILFAIGAQDRLVGVSSACDYPPEAKKIAKIGDFAVPNTEILLELKPDLVVSNYLREPSLAPTLERQGIKVYVADQRNFSDLFDAITRLGELAGEQKRAADLVADMRRRMEAVEQSVSKVPAEGRPRVFIEIAPDPLYTAGKGSFLDELVSKAGGVNIASELNTPFAQVSGEFVIQRDPDVILVSYMGVVQDPAAAMARRIGWSKIKAVAQGRVIADIHPDLLCRPGPRLIEGLERLHAELFAK